MLIRYRRRTPAPDYAAYVADEAKLCFSVKMMGFYLSQYEMRSSTLTESLENQDTIDKTCLEGSKVPQQVDKMFILIVDGTTLAIIDPVPCVLGVSLTDVDLVEFLQQVGVYIAIMLPAHLNCPANALLK
uniref:Uncharacterized protein n=1 Tax=Solanum lycopersicum TaxID=4081 RepID=A0A3Q7FA50_SOLLC